MLERISSFLVTVTEVMGVELFFLPDGRINVTTVVLKKDKRTVLIKEKKEEIISDLKELSAWLAEGVPVCLSVNGKNVLHKKIKSENKEEKQDKGLITDAFPSINPDDFYAQNFVTAGGAYLSIVRKSVLDELINNIKKHGFEIVSLTFGPFDLNNLLSLIEGPKNRIFSGNSELLVSENAIEDFKINPSPGTSEVKIGEERIEHQFLIPYSSALNQFVGLPTPVDLSINSIEEGKEEWKQKQIFIKAGWSVLVLFFLILLGNFFVFSTLNEKNASLTASLDYNEALLIEMKELQKNVTEQQEFLKETGWLNNLKVSFFADRIANSVPAEITLMEMNLNPLDERKSRTEKKPVIINRQIVIKGGCHDPSVLNSWLGEIKEFPWVKDLKDQNYSYDPEKRTGYFEFKIEM